MISMEWKCKAIFIGTILVSGTLTFDHHIRQSLWNETDLTLTKSVKWTLVDCMEVIFDEEYVPNRIKNRGTTSDTDTRYGGGLYMDDCWDIFYRHSIFPRYLPILGGKKFGIAFARVVYRDYKFLEAELAANYQPYNWYCYALDKKSDETFRKRMKALADCIPNVILTKREYEIDRYGRNMWNAYLECMKMLLAYNYEWEYLITLQNWDIQLKTNEELVQIFKWLNGTNDIQYSSVGAPYFDFSIHNWTLAHLHLFRNESKNLETDSHGALLELREIKGQVQCSLSRAFVEWLINDLNTTIMLDQLNSYERVGKDGFFIQTLAANEFLHAPGGFTSTCYYRTLAPGLTRFTLWNRDKIVREKCKSGEFRNYICIFGLEDRDKFYSNRHFFANKVLPEFDMDVIHCWHERMLGERKDRYPMYRINSKKEYYTELPQVRYNEILKRDGHVNLEEFNCTYKFLKEVGYGQEWFYDE